MRKIHRTIERRRTAGVDGKTDNVAFQRTVVFVLCFLSGRARVYSSPPPTLSVVFYAKRPLHLNVANAKNRSALMEWSPISHTFSWAPSIPPFAFYMSASLLFEICRGTRIRHVLPACLVAGYKPRLKFPMLDRTHFIPLIPHLYDKARDENTYNATRSERDKRVINLRTYRYTGYSGYSRSRTLATTTIPPADIEISNRYVVKMALKSLEATYRAAINCSHLYCDLIRGKCHRESQTVGKYWAEGN